MRRGYPTGSDIQSLLVFGARQAVMHPSIHTVLPFVSNNCPPAGGRDSSTWATCAFPSTLANTVSLKARCRPAGLLPTASV